MSNLGILFLVLLKKKNDAIGQNPAQFILYRL